MKTTKKISILLLLSVFVFIGCTNDNDEVRPENTQELRISVANQKGEVISTKTINNSEDFNFPVEQYRKPNQRQMAIGDYQRTAGGPFTEFSAISNAGGIHGDLFFDSSVLGEFYAESLCVSTYEDGTAIVGYHILSVEFPSGVWDSGVIFYWKYNDNGEGANNPKDTSSSNVYILTNWQSEFGSPEEAILGFPCHYFELAPEWGDNLDIASGNIQVK